MTREKVITFFQKEQCIANVVSLSRPLLFGPIVIICVFLGWRNAILSLYIWGCLTDIADGIIARARGKTEYGGQIDSNCDKCYIMEIMIMETYRNPILLPYTFLTGMREAVICYLRFALEQKGFSFPADHFGKAKAWVQYIAVGILELDPTNQALVIPTLQIMTAFTFMSGIWYIFKAWRLVNKKDHSE